MGDPLHTLLSAASHAQVQDLHQFLQLQAEHEDEVSDSEHAGCEADFDDGSSVTSDEEDAHHDPHPDELSDNHSRPDELLDDDEDDDQPSPSPQRDHDEGSVQQDGCLKCSFVECINKKIHKLQTVKSTTSAGGPGRDWSSLVGQHLCPS
jgi:hypothetical protein